MDKIPRDTVDRTWEEVGGFSDLQAAKEMKGLTKAQPNIISFILYFTENQREDVKELATYLTFVICRIFDKSSRTKIPKIGSRKITQCFEANKKWLDKMKFSHKKFIEKRIIDGTDLKQLNVIQYIIEALSEEEPEDVILSKEERAYVFILLKTVIDSLDSSLPD